MHRSFTLNASDKHTRHMLMRKKEKSTWQTEGSTRRRVREPVRGELKIHLVHLGRLLDYAAADPEVPAGTAAIDSALAPDATCFVAIDANTSFAFFNKSIASRTCSALLVATFSMYRTASSKSLPPHSTWYRATLMAAFEYSFTGLSERSQKRCDMSGNKGGHRNTHSHSSLVPQCADSSLWPPSSCRKQRKVVQDGREWLFPGDRPR